MLEYLAIFLVLVPSGSLAVIFLGFCVMKILHGEFLERLYALGALSFIIGGSILLWMYL